jgi:hypothetical protein
MNDGSRLEYPQILPVFFSNLDIDGDIAGITSTGATTYIDSSLASGMIEHGK